MLPNSTFDKLLKGVWVMAMKISNFKNEMLYNVLIEIVAFCTDKFENGFMHVLLMMNYYRKVVIKTRGY